MKQQHDALMFETDINENNVIVSRKYQKKGLSKKERERIEKTLPKVKMHLFDATDLERLQKLAVELQRLEKNESATRMKNLLDKILGFITNGLVR